MQLPILMNTLSYNRALVGAAKSECVIGILYQSSNRISQWTRDELMRHPLNDPEFADFSGRVRWVSIDLGEVSDLGAVFSSEHVQVLYVAPLRGVSLAEIIRITREEKIVTMCGVPDYVRKGISIGMGQKGDRPEILINLSGSRAEGASFDSRLLRIAKVIDGDDEEK